MSEADSIAAEIRAAGQEIRETLWWDSYELIRFVSTKDDRGAKVTVPEAFEWGVCQLRVSGQRATESPNEVAFVELSHYEVALPPTTAAEEVHRIKITRPVFGTTEYSITGIYRGGSAAIEVVAQIDPV